MRATTIYNNKVGSDYLGRVVLALVGDPGPLLSQLPPCCRTKKKVNYYETLQERNFI